MTLFLFRRSDVTLALFPENLLHVRYRWGACRQKQGSGRRWCILQEEAQAQNLGKYMGMSFFDW